MPKIHSIFMLILLLSLTGNAAGAPLHKAAKKGDLDRVKRLLDRGSDVNVKWGYDYTPLHYATMEGRKEVVELLLSKGADINTKDEGGGTPLKLAAGKGHKEIVELLLSKGADVNSKDNKGKTPLHWAAWSGRKEIVELLLSKGANLNVKDKERETPLQEAAKQGHNEIVELLKNYPKKQLLLVLNSNLPLIQAEENKGDQAKKAGNKKKALSYYLAAINLTPPGTDMDLRLRKKTITFVRSMRPKPLFPAEAKRHAMRGQAFLKRAKDKEGFRKALPEFQKVTQLAPWVGSGYFNLALVQEKVDDFDGAIGNLKLYLMANPRARDAAAVEKKIIDLEVAGELKGK